MGVRADIQAGLATRLGTITTANGYTTNVVKVFVDDIPMALDLDDSEVPAILVLAGGDNPEMKHQCYYGNWEFELQLIHNEVADSVMDQFVRDVYKAVFANSPTASINTAFRSIDPTIYNIRPLQIMTDLNMIDANRIYNTTLMVQFTTQLFNL